MCASGLVPSSVPSLQFVAQFNKRNREEGTNQPTSLRHLQRMTPVSQRRDGHATPPHAVLSPLIEEHRPASSWLIVRTQGRPRPIVIRAVSYNSRSRSLPPYLWVGVNWQTPDLPIQSPLVFDTQENVPYTYAYQ